MTRSDSAAHPFAVDPCRRKKLLALSVGTIVPFFAGFAAPGAAQRAGGSLDEPGFAAPPPRTQCRVALVLSGVFARGFAHLGVLFDFDPVRSPLRGIGLGVVPGERIEGLLHQHSSLYRSNAFRCPWRRSRPTWNKARSSR